MQPDQINREGEGARVFEQGRTRDLLRGMVRRLAARRAWEEDLLQEAVIHLWFRENERPGQSASWYIQSCRFHLLNLLRKGRSIDSAKRHSTAALPDADAEDEAQEAADPGIHDTLFALVCARDLVSELWKWLSPVEREILHLRLAGLSSREIAIPLGLSHTAVSHHRRNIARIASWLLLVESPTAKLRQTKVSLKPDHDSLPVLFQTNLAA